MIILHIFINPVQSSYIYIYFRYAYFVVQKSKLLVYNINKCIYFIVIGFNSLHQDAFYTGLCTIDTSYPVVYIVEKIDKFGYFLIFL
jgi:hypothetical protein